MDYLSPKHEELSEQLCAWWARQNTFKNKIALASQVGIHPDTLGDYFSGKRFPKPEVASKLGHITQISCLDSYAEVPAGEGNTAQAETIMTGLDDGQPSGVTISAPQPGRVMERQRNSAVVISLQRNVCPFCRHPIEVFRNCTKCGQHFVWVNLAMTQDNQSGKTRMVQTASQSEYQRAV